jgi:ATP-dependent RNA helicase DeaD
MVFCATRKETDIVARNLQQNGVKAMAIHGGLSQNKRLHVLEQLKREHIDVMVATDVAARGLDVKNISHVYNYDVPNTSEEYVHRVGRTARAGAEGDAITLLTERDYDNFNNVLSDRSLHIERAEVPHFERARFIRHVSHDHRGHRGSRHSFGMRRHHGSSRNFGSHRSSSNQSHRRSYH